MNAEKWARIFPGFARRLNYSPLVPLPSFAAPIKKEIQQICMYMCTLKQSFFTGYEDTSAAAGCIQGDLDQNLLLACARATGHEEILGIWFKAGVRNGNGRGDVVQDLLLLCALRSSRHLRRKGLGENITNTEKPKYITSQPEPERYLFADTKTQVAFCLSFTVSWTFTPQLPSGSNILLMIAMVSTLTS